MHIEVDLETCQGHGKCYLTAPDIFAPDADDDWGRPTILAPDVPAPSQEQLRDARLAATSCPETAISVRE
jgi:ferredoxin